MNFLRNIGIIVSTPLFSSEIIEDTSLSCCGTFGKISMVTFLEDKNLVYVHNK